MGGPKEQHVERGKGEKLLFIAIHVMNLKGWFIILQRETQKGIVLGQGGRMIKQLGIEARKDIEKFLGRKVFLELFVKVRPKWRDNELQLREYGY